MLLQQEQDLGITPKALLAKPKLDPILTYYYDEYNQLQFDRDSEQGIPKPITTGRIRDYCDFFCIQDRYEFFYYIRLIDKVYLTEYTKRHKKD